MRWMTRKTNSRVPFGAQSYQLFSEILKKKADFPEEIAELLGESKKRREKAIGGQDPRKFRSNFMSSQAISDSS